MSQASFPLYIPGKAGWAGEVMLGMPLEDGIQPSNESRLSYTAVDGALIQLANLNASPTLLWSTERQLGRVVSLAIETFGQPAENDQAEILVMPKGIEPDHTKGEGTEGSAGDILAYLSGSEPDEAHPIEDNDIHFLYLGIGKVALIWRSSFYCATYEWGDEEQKLPLMGLESFRENLDSARQFLTATACQSLLGETDFALGLLDNYKYTKLKQ